MNERIRELAEQAHEYVASSNAKNLRKVFEKKFAELIVRECIGIVKEYSEDGPHCQCQMIKQHFGVE